MDVSKVIDCRRAGGDWASERRVATTPSENTLRRDHQVLHSLFAPALESRKLPADNPCRTSISRGASCTSSPGATAIGKGPELGPSVVS